MAGIVRRRDWPFGDWPDVFGRNFPAFFRGFPEMESLVDREGMKLEEFVDEGTLVVKAEMPGIDPEKDVEITVSDNMITISAERRQEEKVEEKGGYRTEFSYGKFVRTLPLPAGATEDDIKASYSDGILEIRVPVDKGKAEAKKVPIQKG
ncbi:MAG: Alpha-crystallin [Acidimicrobiales bacterium]|nr:MAG: Hsp20/alpha crystallin family protein [Actinomycetota bacterium]MBV6510480.1 Alpha-crystallin [Acidimicrobiales bacterium]RIK07165.1 MAG: heat-shock protein Hsp20 [Acidobacteriota bacterium]